MKLNLRKLYNELQQLPHYLPHANTISEVQAERVCSKYGRALIDEMVNFNHANGFGIETRMNGPGSGQYPNAKRLFEGYLYSEAHEAHCDSESSARHGEYDE